MTDRINNQAWMATITSEAVSCAKSTVCQNRLELLVDPGMRSESMAKWAHAAVDHWLSTRVDLTSPDVYDVGTVKGSEHG
jgi:hypothetical protein